MAPSTAIWIVTGIIVVLGGAWLLYLKRAVPMPEEELAEEPLAQGQE
jgi:hypothetical protein